MQYYVAVDKLLTYGFCLEVVDLQPSHRGSGFATCGEPKHTVADPAHEQCCPVSIYVGKRELFSLA
jgi:hypothetical protein